MLGDGFFRSVYFGVLILLVVALLDYYVVIAGGV